MRFFSHIGLAVALTAFCTTAFGQSGGGMVEAKLLTAPSVAVPVEAKESGLGGIVVVRVAIDKEGNVTSVDGAAGPGFVCRSVTRPDVLALRKAASEAALKAKFTPAQKDGKPRESVNFLTFTFPEPKPKSKEENYAAVPVNAVGPRTPKQISGGVLNGKANSLPRPPYPPAARAVRASGPVGIQVLILEDGTVFSAEGVSGHPLLRAAARQAACEAKFAPTRLQGNPVKVSGMITYNFVP